VLRRRGGRPDPCGRVFHCDNVTLHDIYMMLSGNIARPGDGRAGGGTRVGRRGEVGYLAREVGGWKRVVHGGLWT